jgi:hydrocephalus-inducing protein
MLMADHVAPGMDAVFVVRFCPRDDEDYFSELICTTEREKFSVPIRALSSRGMFGATLQLHVRFHLWLPIAIE